MLSSLRSLPADHRPVAAIINAEVMKVQGLNTFRQATKRKAETDKLDVVTVYDSAFYMLELKDCSIELIKASPISNFDDDTTTPELNNGRNAAAGGGPSSRRQSPNESSPSSSTIKDDAYVLVLFPLDNEDSFSALRRPTTVAAVARQFAFLTSEVERNPFAFFSISSYAVIRESGVTILSCTRPDFGGLHALFSLRDYDGRQMGACVFSLTDQDRHPIAEQKNVVMPLTVGGALTGYLKCNIKLSQYRLFPSSVHV